MVSGEVLLNMLRLECKGVGGQRRFARKHKLTPAYISSVLSGRAKMSLGIAHALGYRRVVLWEEFDGR